MTGFRQPVVVGLSGGLGNQMFQYAAGRSLAIRIGAPLALDLSWFGGQSTRQFALSPFRIEAKQHSQFSWLPPRGQAIVSRLSRRWLPRVMGVPVWREPHFHFSSDFRALTAPVYLEGYWQKSERYFRDIRLLLLEEFALREPLPLVSLALLKEISKCDAICVHVRRGDYIAAARLPLSTAHARWTIIGWEFASSVKALLGLIVLSSPTSRPGYALR